MSPSLRIEIPAFVAAIIHLASEPVSENRAQDKDTPKHCDRQESIGYTLHLLPEADRPFVVIL